MLWQSIVPYAPNLQSLSIHTTFVELSLTGPSPWRSFLHLSSLTIDFFDQRDARFFEALQQMRQLTSLEFSFASESDAQCLAESMPSLTGLRSLTLDLGHEFLSILSEITKRLTVLTQLTLLDLSDLLERQPLRFPKGIVDLKIDSWDISAEDLADKLVDLTNLTSLRISSQEEAHLFHSGGVTPLHLFMELGQLKRLKTYNICVDRPFLDAFKALTGLTELRLDGLKQRVDHEVFCQQLRLLSNLKAIRIPFPAKMLVDGEYRVPRGCLTKIREIERFSGRDNVDDATYTAMTKAFPCLRKLR